MFFFRHKAIVCISANDTFSFSFFLDSDKPVIKRQFNMVRTKTETIDGFVNRLTENIVKRLQKKKSKKTKKADDNPIEYIPEVFFKAQNEILETKTDSLAEEFLKQKDLQMEIFNVPFDIEVNPPFIQKVKLPDVIMSGYLIYPFKLEINNGDNDDSVFEWFVSDIYDGKKNTDSFTLKCNWTKRHSGFYYKTSDDDLNRFIKLLITPKFGDRIGLEYEIISKFFVTKGK